jgi:AraC family transcriptional regulator
MGKTVTLDAADEELNVAAEAARALDFIEAHLFEPLSVEIIARFCNASPFHFSRRFTQRQGESVMAYVRGRRLDKAAERLAAEPSISLASMALDCGFETQSAFTRAFTRAFGAAPGVFRRIDAPPPRKRNLRMKEPLQLIENLAHEGPIRLAGLSGRFDPSSYVRIPELWKRFNSLMMGWPGRLGGTETIAVFSDRDLIARSFEHFASVRISPDARPPGELEIRELPAQAWLQYHQPLTTAELHVQLITAEAEIRGERVAASGHKLRAGPDLQVYAPNFKTAPGWWVEHWLPAKEG